LLSLACVAGAPRSARAQPDPPLPGDASVRAIEALERAAGGSLKLRRSAHAGVATFLRAERGDAISTGEAATAPAESRARAFLRRYGDAVGVRDPRRFVTTRSTSPDVVGMEHVRLQQMHRGLRVRAAELSVHLHGANVVAVNGRTLPDLIGLETAPTLDAFAALSIAAVLVAEAYDGAGAELSVPELEVFNAGLLDGTRAPSRLAWYIEASAEALRVSIWIDAHEGEALLHFNDLPDALDRLIYDAMETSDLPGTLVRTEGQAPTGGEEVDSVYEFTGDTYDYFFTEHGRDSYDGQGAPMRASVRYCSTSSSCVLTCPCSNAFWYPTFAVFGLLRSDAIVGHEFTHGVVDHSADLVYQNQPGAIDESFADIFGESIDLTNGAGLDTPEVRWLIEEDLLPASGIRNMADPTLGFLTPDPGKMTDPELACTTEDSGGVHTNSGIGNHAYALMVDGGTYNGITLTGIGLTKAGKVEYRALTAYLLTSSTYQDLYDALQQSCADLVGTSGISASDCVRVKKAADAVEMDLPWPCDCGNGSLQSGEGCDDGNNLPGDGCSPVCLIETKRVPIVTWYGWMLLVGAVGLLGLLAIVRRPGAHPG
jgi:cysteine-rich repeat protein